MSSRHGVLSKIQCPESRHIVELALDNGWEWMGFTKSGHGQLRWPDTDQCIPFAATPSDKRYAWRQLARRIKSVSGLDFTQNGNRRRSRKNPNQPDREVAASRARYQRQVEAQRRAAEHHQNAAAMAREQREAQAARAAESERRRREIESLMRPGWGH